MIALIKPIEHLQVASDQRATIPDLSTGIIVGQIIVLTFGERVG